MNRDSLAAQHRLKDQGSCSALDAAAAGAQVVSFCPFHHRDDLARHDGWQGHLSTGLQTREFRSYDSTQDSIEYAHSVQSDELGTDLLTGFLRELEDATIPTFRLHPAGLSLASTS